MYRQAVYSTAAAATAKQQPWRRGFHHSTPRAICSLLLHNPKQALLLPTTATTTATTPPTVPQRWKTTTPTTAAFSTILSSSSSSPAPSQEQASNAAASLTIALLEETYNPWERRAPIAPHQIQDFLTQFPNCKVLVQPSSHRVFSDRQYEQAGAIIQHDISSADIVLGVKRPSSLQDLGMVANHKNPNHNNKTNNNKMFLCFSHVIKGQPENMALLQEFLSTQNILLDYECIVQNGMQTTKTNTEQKQKRLVAFGKYAGLAGMIDTWSVLGRRLLLQGYSTPFLNSCPPSIYHSTLQDAKRAVQKMGEQIAADGLPAEMEPIIVAMTGGPTGNVHGGVREIFDLVPHELVPVVDLPQVLQEASSSSSSSSTLNSPQYKIYGVVPESMELYQRKDGGAFERSDFMQHPEQYTCNFAETVAPYIHVLVNAIYWDHRYPRLLTKDDLFQLYEMGNERLLVVSDISCDVNGSIEFLERSTTIDSPCYQYDPWKGQEISETIQNHGVTVMGVDILPTELPLESSTHFGTAVSSVLEELAMATAAADKKEETASTTDNEKKDTFIDISKLSPRLANAIITTKDGTLAPNFQYLNSIMKRACRKQKEDYNTKKATKSMILMLEGHLFDSGLINQVLDVLESNQCGFSFEECLVRHQNGSDPKSPPVKSSAILKVTGNPETVNFDKVESKIAALVMAIEKAEATFRRIDQKDSSSIGSKKGGGGVGGAAYVKDGQDKRVLLLGSGRVSKSVVDLLGRSKDRTIIVAGEDESQARAVAAYAQRGRHVGLDVANDSNRLADLVKRSDVVISLLPVPMHPDVAKMCIDFQTNMVTASYESDEMRKLGDQATKAGIIILNEVGLDPGLDHMSAMRLIDDIHSRGGTVTSFSSVCGGLPAPEAADNPLKYKFSWSPRGVISASQNSARYRWNGHELQIPGDELLQNASPFLDAFQELQLECLPNRDSLQYETTYGLQNIPTIFRGTLRYRGFSSLMHAFQNMGLFEAKAIQAESWAEVLDQLRQRRGGFEDMEDFLLVCAEDDPEEAIRFKACLDWLGMTSSNARLPANEKTLIDMFCHQLERKLKFQDHERDMIVMHHTIGAEFDDGTTEEHHSSLQAFGDRSMSAMCKTVGFTTAAATELVLNGSLNGSSGLLLPIEKKIYGPTLDIVKREGIVFEETVTVESPGALSGH